MQFYVRESGHYRRATAEELIAGAKALLNRRFCRGRALTSPSQAQDFLKAQLGGLGYEYFSVLWLDSRHRIIEFQPLFRGSIDGAAVHAGEVVKEGLTRNAAACILAHAHPSGVAEPSQADELISRRLRDALALVDIRLLDHIVVGEECISLAERGVL